MFNWPHLIVKDHTGWIHYTIAYYVKITSYRPEKAHHYSDVVMTAIASQLTNLTIAYSTLIMAQPKKACTSHVIITTVNIGSAWRDWTHVAWQGLNMNCERRDMRKMSQSGFSNETNKTRLIAATKYISPQKNPHCTVQCAGICSTQITKTLGSLSISCRSDG